MKPLFGTSAFWRSQDDPQDPSCYKCSNSEATYEDDYGCPLCEKCYAEFCAFHDLENGEIKDFGMINDENYIAKKIELCESFGINPITETLKSVFGNGK